MQLILYNRFSYWEDENDDEDESESSCLSEVIEKERGIENESESEYITIRRTKKTKSERKVSKE